VRRGHSWTPKSKRAKACEQTEIEDFEERRRCRDEQRAEVRGAMRRGPKESSKYVVEIRRLVRRRGGTDIVPGRECGMNRVSEKEGDREGGERSGGGCGRRSGWLPHP
jgi:hypothetical protein